MIVMAGASPETFRRVEPAFRAFATAIFHVGPVGMGMTFKVVNNLLSHANLAALAEALALGVAAGADPALLCEVISRSSGQSRQGDERLRRRILPGDFTPGMTVDLAYKDSELGCALGREHGVPLFMANTAHAVYELARREGLGSLDYSALIQLWERWLGITVRASPGASMPSGLTTAS